MCSNVDFLASKRRRGTTSSSRRNTKRRPIRKVPADGVRALRLRQLIERCVIAGIAPPKSRLAHGPPHMIPLHHPARGGVEIAFARQLAMYLAHVACGMNFAEAGALYGRHAKTAAHGCRLVEDKRDDPAFDRIVALLERAVRIGLVQIEPASTQHR